MLMNGMARGTVPADHELAFSRTVKGGEVMLRSWSVPMDFSASAVFGARPN